MNDNDDNKDNIEIWELDKLIPYDKNPVKHPKADIKKMAGILEQYGCRPPILIESNGKIVDGHLRVLAAKTIKLKKLPAIICDDWTEAQITAYRLSSRNSATWADWDDQLLAIEFNKLKNLEFDMDILGFAQKEFDALDKFFDENLGKKDNKGNGNGENDDSESITKTSIIKLGDLFVLDGHRIICGDCTSLQNVELLMDGKLATMIFEDPPYNLSVDSFGCDSMSGTSQVKNHGDFKMAAGELNNEQFTEFLRDIFKFNIRFSTNGSIHYICMDWRHIGEILEAGKIYNEFKQLCVWVKDNAGMGVFYRSQHELIFVFKNGKDKHINNFELGQHGRYRTNVWEYPSSNSFAINPRIQTEDGREVSIINPDLKEHPTPKPLPMVIDACLDCSNEGNIILDLFLGGGTTLIAAQETGRLCYGMEIEPKYVEVTIRRYAKKFGDQINFKHLNGDLKLLQFVDNI